LHQFDCARARGC